jgi:hypothetical protein
MRTRRSPIVLEPPSPATVEMAQVHRVPHGLRLRRVVPRYQSPSALPTEMLPALSNPADRNVRPMFTGTDAINRAPTCDSPLSIKDGGAGSRRVPVEEGSRDTTGRRDGATGWGRHCVLCGAALPPWRDICAAHDARGGRGLPPPLRLQPLTVPAASATTPTIPVTRASGG